jgi:hypothetical protein
VHSTSETLDAMLFVPVAARTHPHVNSDHEVAGDVSANSVVDRGWGMHRGSRVYQSFCPVDTATSQARMSSPVMVIRAPEKSSMRAAIKYKPAEYSDYWYVSDQYAMSRKGC